MNEIGDFCIFDDAIYDSGAYLILGIITNIRNQKFKYEIIIKAGSDYHNDVFSDIDLILNCGKNKILTYLYNKE